MRYCQAHYRPILISIITGLLVVLAGHLWLLHAIEKNNEANNQLLTQITKTEAAAIQTRLEHSLIAPKILAAQLDLNNIQPHIFNAYAETLIKNLGGISNLQLAPEGVITLIHPLKGNEAAIGHNILQDDKRRAEALRAIQLHRMTIAGPFELIQGGLAIIGRYPIYVDNRFWGFSSVLIYVDDLINSSRLPSLEAQGYRYELAFKEPNYNIQNQVFARSKTALSSHSNTVSIPLKDKHWQLSLSYDRPSTTINPIGAYIALVIVAFILAYLLYQKQLAPARLAKHLKQAAASQRYQNQFLQAVLDNVKDAIVTCDSDGQLNFFNKASTKLHGKDSERLPPSEWSKKYQLFHPDGITPLKAEEVPLYRAYRGENVPDTEIVIKREGSDERRVVARGLPLIDEQGKQMGAVISMHDISALHFVQQKQQVRSQILQNIIDNKPLPLLLEQIALDIEQQMKHARCSISLVSSDGKQLIYGAAPHLPDFYNEAVSGLTIADNVGSCGTAAFRKERVLVRDVAIHPYWKDYKELTQRAGITACWSQPILSSAGKLLGTFALYHALPQIPSPKETAIIEDAATLTALTIERQQTSDQLNKLGQVVEQNPNAVVITDQKGTIEYVNPRFSHLTGYSPAEVIGKSPNIISSGEADNSVYEELWSTLLSGQNWRGELHNKRKDGSCYWARNHISPIDTDQGAASHFVAVQEDITEFRRINEVVSQQASHDSLTGLLNRTGFEHSVDALLKTVHENRSQNLLFYIDITGFKVINDSCSHIAGDELLRQFGQLLFSTLPQTESISRLGIDEFAIIMDHCSLQQGLRSAQHLLQAIQQFTFSWQQQSFNIAISLGITTLDIHSENTATAMLQAETACSIAKEQGLNKYHLFEAVDAQRYQDYQTEISWVSEIQDALTNDRFRLFVQKIEPLQRNGLPNYEVLLRMEMPDGTLAAPGLFLPVAERHKLAAKIDTWVFDNCMQWLARHPASQQQFDVLAINLSGQSLADATLLSHIYYEVANQALPASKLKFEITETAAIDNLSQATAFIDKLRSQGCKFALDDFGSGLSSFAYLKNLPVDTLKIDGFFVRDMHTDSVNCAMVRSIHDIGHIMGMETVAEFVENDEIRQLLVDMGVTYGQGYGIEKPQPIEQVLGRATE